MQLLFCTCLLLALIYSTCALSSRNAFPDEDVIREAFEKRLLLAKILNNSAENIDLVFQNFYQEKIMGHGLTIVGGLVGLVSPHPIIIPMTFGALGYIWNYMAADSKIKYEREILEMVITLVEEDNQLQEEVRHEIQKFEILDKTEKYKYMEASLGIMRSLGAGTLAIGPEALTGCLTPLSELFTGIPVVKNFLSATGQTGKALLAPGAKGARDETVLKIVETVVPNDWIKKLIIGPVYEAAQKAAKEAATNVVPVITVAAPNAAKEAATNVLHIITEAAQKVAKEAAVAETARLTKIVGGITFGLNAICLYDVYMITTFWEGSKEGAKTELGIELRRIASELEKQMSKSGG